MKKKQTTNPAEDKFKNLVDLMAIYSDAWNRLESLEAEANGEYLSIIDDVRDDYATAQEKLTTTEIALEELARAHPEWFESRQSLKTPYGTVKFRASTKLEAPNEQASLALIEREGEAHSDFDPEYYIREKKELDLEALGKLPDGFLKRFKIYRVPNNTFKVEPAKMDIGKAVEAK